MQVTFKKTFKKTHAKKCMLKTADLGQIFQFTDDNNTVFMLVNGTEEKQFIIALTGRFTGYAWPTKDSCNREIFLLSGELIVEMDG